MKYPNPFSFLGIENTQKEIPEKCKNNFLLLIQYVFSSHIDGNTHFIDLIKSFKKSGKYIKFFQSKVDLKNLYLSTFRNISNENPIKNYWNMKKIMILCWIISTYEILNETKESSFNTYDWICVSNCFPSLQSEELKYKWKVIFNFKISRGKYNWSKDEDSTLIHLLRSKYPQIFSQSKSNVKWSSISFEMHKIYPYKVIKNPKSIRERWLNHLSPFLKKEIWTYEDDVNLLELTIKYQKKWSLIASENFPHKTQHSIKNRVVSLLTNYSCDNRKEVHEILKHDFSPYVGKALEKIKKDRNYDKMKQKKEKNIKEEAIQIKKEKETNEKEKQQIENSKYFF